VNLSYTPEDTAFRDEVRTWLAEHLTGPFEKLKGRGGMGDMDGEIAGRKAWEKELAKSGWTCLGWPTEHGGRGASLFQEVIFREEYARANGPGRAGLIGEGLLGPTLIHFGTPAQQQRFLPGIVAGTEYWCQGYSEPDAGSDLASVRTRAVREGDEWVITGQKVWTSLADSSDWCFVLCRTDPEAPKHQGISYLLVPMGQPGIKIVPIRQMTGRAEFAEVFFDEARTAADLVVGPVHGGWKVAMGTLALERGTSTLGQQLAFVREFERVCQVAGETGADKEPLIRDRIAEMWMRLQVIRLNSLRILSNQSIGAQPRENYITKLYWASWHRDLGELAMDVLGSAAALADERHADLHALYLWSRADTIYAGTNQIQRNLIAQRALGLPR
jgi:acyl-CoA dehydrogenase